MRPTLKDVATRAGVSVSTVSYALNDASKIALSSDTRARVKRIAKEIGYIPNSVAQSLRARASRSVGMLVTKPLTNPRYAAIVQGASAALAAHRMHLTIVSDPSGDAYLDDYRSGRLDGLVFVGHDDESVPEGILEAARRDGLPLVALDCGLPDGDAWHSSVDFDYARGAEEMVAALAERGIRSVVHVRPDVSSRAERLRERVLADAIAARPEMTRRVMSTGLTDEMLRELDVSATGAPTYASQLGARLDDVLGELDADASETAVLCSWGADVEPTMASRRVREGGILVAALAAGSLSPLVWPHLLYSRLPLERAGAESARLVMQVLAGDPHEHLVLAPDLDDPAPALRNP